LLQSRLFQGSPELAACLEKDSAHITPGSAGEHVRLIQRALVYLGELGISGEEYRRGMYGHTTASAVLRYKKQRRIINFSYQTEADNIVSKMTVARLDQDVCAIQNLPGRA
jgi:hypothetical protein